MGTRLRFQVALWSLPFFGAGLLRSDDARFRVRAPSAQMRRFSVLARGVAGLAAAGLTAGWAVTLARRSEQPWATTVAAERVLDESAWPASFPLTDAHLARVDTTNDAHFYAQPRFVLHVDEAAVAALNRWYAEVLPRGGHVLDLMSSWTSHLAQGAGADKADTSRGSPPLG